MNVQAAQYHDFSGFNEMRRDARAEGEGQGENVKKVAQQFEAIFVQMMMKSMRESVQEGGLLNDDSMRFYQDMMDQQLSVELSGQGGVGLSATIERQLSPVQNPGSNAIKLAMSKQG